MDLSVLNPAIMPLGLIKINSVNGTLWIDITADNSVSKVNKVYYKDLKVKYEADTIKR